MGTLLYHETQRMLGAYLLAGILIPLVLFIIYQFRPRPFVSRLVSFIIIIISSFIILILSLLRLDTLYYTDRIEYQFISIFKAKYEVVTIKNVKKAQVIVYDPTNFGGYGQKGNATTKVYNTSGTTGLMLSFYTGKSLIIGTQQPDSLYAHIKNAYPF